MENTEKSGFIFTILKGTLLSVTSTLIGVLIFAGLIKATAMDVSVIKPVNQFIKIIAIFIGCLFSVKGKMALIKGILIGALATVMTYLVFALFGGGVSFKVAFLIDIVFAVIVGGISSIILVSIKK
jgi:putative membrane protein (TIGR04086 family)